MRKSSNSRLVAGALALMMMAPIGNLASSAFAQTSTSASSQVPQPDQGGVNWAGVGYGAGSLATNILYIPAKLVYALFGGIVGGGAWCLTGGNTQTANTIWRSSLGGDYVVTPDMLAGKEPIHFSGPTETAPLPPDSSTTTVQPMTAPPPPPATTSSVAPRACGGRGATDGPGGRFGRPPTFDAARHQHRVTASAVS